MTLNKQVEQEYLYLLSNILHELREMRKEVMAIRLIQGVKKS